MLFLKRVKEFAPVASIIIIIFGLLRQIFFYAHFGIEIQNYLTLSELILSISKELIVIVIITLFITFQAYVYLHDAKNRINGALSGTHTRNRWRLFRGELIVSFLLIAAIIMDFIKNGETVSILWFTALLVFNLYPIFFFETKLKFQTLNRTFNPLSFNIILISILVIISLSVMTYMAIKSSEKGQFIGTIIQTKDSTYISDTTHYFIGKTEKFYFIHNQNKKSTLVIPETEVVNAEIHHN